MSEPMTNAEPAPEDLAALQRGAELHAEGKFDEAHALYIALLDGPVRQAAAAHYLLGLLQTDRGDGAGALAHYEAALNLGAASPELWFKRAELLRLAGQFQEALQSHDQAIALQPGARHFWNTRGIALEALGRLADAVESYDRAIALSPGYVQAHHNRASALFKLERFEDAVESFDKALSHNPNIPDSWNFRAVTLATLERFEEALSSSDRALALRPIYPEAHNNRSIALRALLRPEEALTAAETALAQRPGFAEALNSKGSALAKLNRYREACDTYRLALVGKPDDPSIHLNLGLSQEAVGALQDAQSSFAAAQRLAPLSPDAWFASGLTHIRAGAVQRGFALYETRWTQKGGPRHGYPQESLWLGQEPLGSRRLLVHAEQGFGDVIQFCRFAPRAAPASQLILHVQAPLKRLIDSLQSAGQVGVIHQDLADFDVHIPIMSLPLALHLELKDLAAAQPYLHAEPGLAKAWADRLPPAGGLRIGLAWSGNPLHDNDRNRSMPFDALTPLLNGDVQFVSLQKDYRPADMKSVLERPQILRFEQALTDFAETAGLVAACDLVIAVDTAVAHLAGALGKPVWIALPRFCDWRWMNDRSDSPWYRSATLFRQSEDGDWSSVIASMVARLSRGEL